MPKVFCLQRCSECYQIHQFSSSKHYGPIYINESRENSTLTGFTAHVTKTKQFYVQPRLAAVNASLPALSAERTCACCCAASAPAAIDRFFCPPAAAVAVDRRDRQTDGQTDARPLNRPCSACYARSVNKCVTNPTLCMHLYSINYLLTIYQYILSW